MIGTCDAVVPREQTYSFLEATPPDGVTLLGWPALFSRPRTGSSGWCRSWSPGSRWSMRMVAQVLPRRRACPVTTGPT